MMDLVIRDPFVNVCEVYVVEVVGNHECVWLLFLFSFECI